MTSEMSTRIDKWLWAVRIFKTRSLAVEYCKKGRVIIDDSPAKPSKEVHPNDTVFVRKPPITYQFRVKGIPKNRIGAKLVPEYLENITPEEELRKLDPGYLAFYGTRERGAGRPTKKDRRSIDSIIDSSFSLHEWEDDSE